VRIFDEKMESEQCVADLLNSICRANLKNAVPPSDWQDVVREYFCDELNSSDDSDDEQSPAMADDDYEPESVVVDPVKECKQPVDFVVSESEEEELKKVYDHK